MSDDQEKRKPDAAATLRGCLMGFLTIVAFFGVYMGIQFGLLGQLPALCYVPMSILAGIGLGTRLARGRRR
ncbi:MAG: hypothetical protein GF403_06565 [Candidatus Coatesbacteria bacterium]|nr:hypothetical protein [Candidatus Coatesbacteria bacterium]